MQRLVIGCGYLGLRAARAWLAQGDSVAALTRSSERSAELRALGIEPIVGDVLAPDSLANLPAAETVLYAVAFDRRGTASRREVTVGGLANALHRLAGRVRRLIYISTTSVYGQDSGEWVDEESPCTPTRENGRLALEAEQTAGHAAAAPSGGSQRSFGLHILRLAGIYGPNRLLRRVESLRAGEPLPDRPDAWLNLIHVDDAVRAVLASADHAQNDLTCLVSDGHPGARRDYYGLLAQLIGAPPPQFEAAADEDARASTSGLNKRCANQRLRNVLGVTLEYPSFEVGLPSALRATTG